MNKELLRSIMALHNDTNKDMADLLGITEQSFSYKINEKPTENGGRFEFKQGEIAKIRQHYGLSPEQVANIFFA